MGLRELAPDFPWCCACGKPNHDGQQLCLAHSNALKDGRGAFHKSKDFFGAFLCGECHDLVDGRSGRLEKYEKRQMQEEANKVMLRYLIEQDMICLKK